MSHVKHFMTLAIILPEYYIFTNGHAFSINPILVARICLVVTYDN